METRSNSHGYGHDGYYGPSSSSSPTSFDHLFGPKNSASSSSTFFGSIFSPPSTVPGTRTGTGTGRDYTHHQPVAGKKQEEGSKSMSNMNKSSSMYETERTVAEPCYLSSSIYYGGQENYSPTSSAHSHISLKKDDAPSASASPDSVSRGNWWQGSFYY